MNNLLGFIVWLFVIYAFAAIIFFAIKIIFGPPIDDKEEHRRQLIDEAHARLPGATDFDALILLRKERRDKLQGLVKTSKYLKPDELKLCEQLQKDFEELCNMIHDEVTSVSI